MLAGQEGTAQLEDWKQVIEYWSARPATALNIEMSEFSPAPLPSYDVSSLPGSLDDLRVEVSECTQAKAGVGGVSHTLSFVLQVESSLAEYDTGAASSSPVTSTCPHPPPAVSSTPTTAACADPTSTTGTGGSAAHSWSVRRSLEQVVSLRKALTTHFSTQCVVVPPLTRSNVKYLAALTDNLILMQRVSVLRFLRRLVIHPMIRTHPTLVSFLKPTSLWKAPKQEGGGNDTTGGPSQVVAKLLPQEKFRDPDVDALRAWQGMYRCACVCVCVYVYVCVCVCVCVCVLCMCVLCMCSMYVLCDL
jgi:PX domain